MDLLSLALLIAALLCAAALLRLVGNVIALLRLIKRAEGYAGYVQGEVKRSRAWERSDYYPRVLDGIRLTRRTELSRQFSFMQNQVGELVPEVDLLFVQELDAVLGLLVDAFEGTDVNVQNVAVARLNYAANIIASAIANLTERPLVQRQFYRWWSELGEWADTVIYVLPDFKKRLARIRART